MIKILYVHGYKGDKYGPSFQRLAKYADAANFAGEKVEMLSFDYDPEEPAKSIRELRITNSCQIDFERTFMFDKYNGCWVFNIIDDKQIMHRYRVSLSLAS